MPGVAPVGVHGDVDQAVRFVEADRVAAPRGEPRQRDVLAQRVAQRLKPAKLVQQVAADEAALAVGQRDARRAGCATRPSKAIDQGRQERRVEQAFDGARQPLRGRHAQQAQVAAVCARDERAGKCRRRAHVRVERQQPLRGRTERTLARGQAPDLAVPVVGSRAGLDQPQSSVAAGVGAHKVTRAIGRAAVDDQDLANLIPMGEQPFETRRPGGALH